MDAARQSEKASHTRLALAEAELVALRRRAELRTIDDIRISEAAATAKEIARGLPSWGRYARTQPPFDDAITGQKHA